jgi:voltage-dependent calcium channel T type alpha-1G
MTHLHSQSGIVYVQLLQLAVSVNYRFRIMCKQLVERKWFDNAILLFIALNCITLAMERPNIPPDSTERIFLSTANYIFTVVFAVEMFVKVAYQCTN